MVIPFPRSHCSCILKDTLQPKWSYKSEEEFLSLWFPPGSGFSWHTHCFHPMPHLCLYPPPLPPPVSWHKNGHRGYNFWKILKGTKFLKTPNTATSIFATLLILKMERRPPYPDHLSKTNVLQLSCLYKSIISSKERMLRDKDKANPKEGSARWKYVKLGSRHWLETFREDNSNAPRRHRPIN